MATNAPIVDAVVGIRGDTTQLTADINAAKSKVEAAGTTGADAATKATAATNQQAAATSALGEELRKVKKTYGEQIEVVQGLIGKIAAIGAVATTFYKIGEVIGTQIVDKLTSAAQKANDFLMTVNRADARAAIKQIADQVSVLNAEIASTDEIQQQMFRAMAASGNSLGALLAKDREKLIAERKILIEQLMGLSNRAQADIADADAEALREQGRKQLENMQQLTALTSAAMRESMTEEEQMRAESEQKRNAISAAFVNLTAEQRLAVEQDVLAAIEAINAETDRRIAEAKKKRDEEAAKRAEEERKKREDEADDLRRWYEEQERNAKRVQKAWTDSYRAIREESNRAFATDQAASMVQFAAQMRIEGAVATANMNQIVVQGVG
jgi:hypothetical protein